MHPRSANRRKFAERRRDHDKAVRLASRRRLHARMERLEPRHLLTVLFEADFSDALGFGDPDGFTSSGPSDEWHLSTGRGNDPGHSADSSFYFGSGEDPFGNGSYGFNADGTLISPPIDLTGATLPRLTFNHYLEVEAGFDFATVSIVRPLLPNDVIATSGMELPNSTLGFEAAVFDLSAYVDDTIQVAFRLTSDNIQNAEGWYVDDVVIQDVGPVVGQFDFSDELGNPDPEGFTSSGPNDQWHLSTGRGNDAGHTADDSFYFGSGEGPAGGGTYGDTADGTLTSPAIDLTSATSAELVFNHFLDVEPGFDFATVSVLHPGGPTIIATSGSELPNSTGGFQGVTLDLTPFVGDNIQVAFRLSADDSVTEEGWYIDDVGFNIQSPTGGPPAPDAWIQQGPIGANLRSLQNISPGNSIGGATHTVLAHPIDPNVLYVGTVNGGIWKTNNALDPIPNWTPQTDDMQSLSIGAMAFDPTDPSFQTLVAVTSGYSSFGGVSSDRGLVYRTTNGGKSWTDVGGAGVFGETLSGVAARGNNIVVTSRANGGGIFRSTNGGASFSVIIDADFVDNDNFSDLVEDPTNLNRLYASNTGEGGAGGPGGIYRSDNFGATWDKVTGPPINAEMNDLLVLANSIEMAVAPTSGRLYVAILLRSQPEAIFHSNTAGNVSPIWTPMDIPVLPQGGGTPIANASNASPIVINSPGHGLTNPSRGVHFAVIDGVTGNTAANGFHRINVLNADNFELSGTTGNGAYTGGGTWTKVAGPNPTPKDEPEGGAQGRTHFSIVADPTDEDILYLGGDRQDQPNLIGGFNITGALFRGDASIPPNPNVAPSPQWDHLTHAVVDFDPTGGTANVSAPHADSREMVFDALGNLIEVDDGGIYKRTSPRDNTGDWFSLVGNLAATEVHDVAYDSVSNTLIGGLQDNATLYQPASGATFWEFLSGGDGGDVAVDDVSLAASGQSLRYSSSQNLGNFRRSTWDAAGNLLSSAFPALNVVSGAAYDPAFNTPVALNAVDPNRLLFGMDNGIYESLDQGENISQVSSSISPTRSTAGNAIAYGGTNGGVPNPDVAYVGDFDGNVHVRTTSGGVFTSSNPSGGSTADIRDVVIRTDDWQFAYAIDSDQVFFTSNAGANWIDITGNLAAVGASGFRSLEYVEGSSDDWVILGTNRGVYSLATSSTPPTWIPLGTDLPNAVVFDMDYDQADDVLVASTMGRGVWKLENVRHLLSGRPDGLTFVSIRGSFLDIDDITGIHPDRLKIQADVANSQYIISGIDTVFDVDANVVGATGDGTDVVTVPFSSVPGSTVTFFTRGGDDTLTVDFSLGDFPQRVDFLSDSLSTSDDTLHLVGGSFPSVDFNAVNDQFG